MTLQTQRFKVIQDCTEHHLRQMLAACCVVLQQYRTLGRYESDVKGSCVLCDTAFDNCRRCPWVILKGGTCVDFDRWGDRYCDERIKTLSTEWIPQIDAELERRGHVTY